MGAIVVVVLALIGCMGFCIFKKCFNKGKKPKKVRERKGGRGRKKKDKDGEDGDEKKVSSSKNVVKCTRMPEFAFPSFKNLCGRLRQTRYQYMPLLPPNVADTTDLIHLLPIDFS